jgi:hypothetical protein
MKIFYLADEERSTKEQMANPASMKTDQAYNGLHPVADVHDHLRN